MDNRLALHGGAPVVTTPAPHADRLLFTDADRAAIAEFLSQPSSPNSFFGREGLLREYEDALASFFGRRFCLLTNSGTSALHSAFFAAGIEPGDEVIAPTCTFHACITPVLQLGAVPVLADVEPDTGNLDPDEVVKKLSPKTRAVVVTPQRGHPAQIARLLEIAREHKLRLIEDVTMSIGSTMDGVRAGSASDIACFSLGSTKLLSGGMGGGLVVDDPDMYDRATLLGHFGRRARTDVHSPALRQLADTGYGLHYRMHTVAVAMSYGRFRRLDALMAARHERFGLISQMLAETGVFVPSPTRAGVFRGVWQGYCADYVRPQGGPSVEDVVRALQAEGLEVTTPFQRPLHQMRLFTTRRDDLRRRVPMDRRPIYNDGDFPRAEAHVANQIGFPLFLDEPMSLIEQYGAACRKVAAHLFEVVDGPRPA